MTTEQAQAGTPCGCRERLSDRVPVARRGRVRRPGAVARQAGRAARLGDRPRAGLPPSSPACPCQPVRRRCPAAARCAGDPATGSPGGLSTSPPELARGSVVRQTWGGPGCRPGRTSSPGRRDRTAPTVSSATGRSPVWGRSWRSDVPGRSARPACQASSSTPPYHPCIHASSAAAVVSAATSSAAPVTANPTSATRDAAACRSSSPSGTELGCCPEQPIRLPRAAAAVKSTPSPCGALPSRLRRRPDGSSMPETGSHRESAWETAARPLY